VKCDPLRIEQTLNNLVSNAIKYSPGGGEVKVNVSKENGTAVVTVSDHGIGIASDDLSHLWEPFRRTGVSAEIAPGVGLGLSVAKRIIDAHHGTITVKSAVGAGSAFSVHLPMPDAGDSRHREEAPQAGSTS